MLITRLLMLFFRWQLFHNIQRRLYAVCHWLYNNPCRNRQASPLLIKFTATRLKVWAAKNYHKQFCVPVVVLHMTDSWALATREWDELFQGDKWRPWEYCLSLKKKRASGAVIHISAWRTQTALPYLLSAFKGRKRFPAILKKTKSGWRSFSATFCKMTTCVYAKPKSPFGMSGNAPERAQFG